MSHIGEILNTRGENYGSFESRSIISQQIKRAMVSGKSWNLMSCDKQEALEMIASKISRIVNGKHDHEDSWTDIIGYATLVENTLK